MIKYSIAVVATLAMIGCGGGSSDKKSENLTHSDKKATISGLRSFGDNVASSDSLENTKISSSLSRYNGSNYDDNRDSMCQSGSLDITPQNNEQKITFVANNCKDGYSTINGSAVLEMNEKTESGSAKVLSDLSILDEYFSLLIKKDSWVKLESNSINDDEIDIKITANFKAVVNDEKFEANNLSFVMQEEEYPDYDKESFYIESGEMLMGEFYFKVDPSHDQSKTAIATGENGFISGGVIKLLDGAGHKIEIAVVSKDELALKIDENGDGSFSDNEITTEVMDIFPTSTSHESSSSGGSRGINLGKSVKIK